MKNKMRKPKSGYCHKDTLLFALTLLKENLYTFDK